MNPICRLIRHRHGVDYDQWLDLLPKTFQCKSFHLISLVLGLCRWIDDRLGSCTCLITDCWEWKPMCQTCRAGRKIAYPELYEKLRIRSQLYTNLIIQSRMGSCDGYWQWSLCRDHGISFIGNNATLVLGRWMGSDWRTQSKIKSQSHWQNLPITGSTSIG